jgi:hypothetical protein
VIVEVVGLHKVAVPLIESPNATLVAESCSGTVITRSPRASPLPHPLLPLLPLLPLPELEPLPLDEAVWPVVELLTPVVLVLLVVPELLVLLALLPDFDEVQAPNNTSAPSQSHRFMDSSQRSCSLEEDTSVAWPRADGNEGGEQTSHSSSARWMASSGLPGHLGVPISCT